MVNAGLAFRYEAEKSCLTHNEGLLLPMLTDWQLSGWLFRIMAESYKPPYFIESLVTYLFLQS